MTSGIAAPVLRPGDLGEVRAAVLDTSGPLAVAGAGTAAAWAGDLRPVEAVLDTTALTGVIAHNPGDMTVPARAGTPLRELAAELAGHGQHVSFDAARAAAGATVGGLVATGDAGPAALVHGSLRDLVIGVTLVLSDGSVARSGGHVIKNVAGYDLAKLVHGSYGTLAVIAEVVLRLHPVPQASATLALDCPLDEAAGYAAALLGGPFEPAALEWTSDGTLLVRVEATEGALRGRLDRLREALTRVDERHSRHIGRDESAVRQLGDEPWQRHAELTRGAPGSAVLRVGVRPSRLPGLLAALPATAVTAGLGTGVATVSVPPDAVAAAHEAVAAAGGTSVLRDRPTGAGPAWGPAPTTLPVLRAVKAALDPDDRLGPGRFDPWM
jgi:glycolate oxidase FAD binding subunit